MTSSIQTKELDRRYILSCEKRISEYSQNTQILNMRVEQCEMEIEMYKKLMQSKAWRFVNKIWYITGALKRLIKRG
jgi:predicted RNase H-like nuclease (RuvC/YqgF family)